MAIAELTLSGVAGYACAVYKVITHKLQAPGNNRSRSTDAGRAAELGPVMATFAF